MKKIVLFVVSFLIIGGLIYFSDTTQTIQAFMKASPIILTGVIGLWFFDTIMRTLRWQILLKRIDIKIPFFESWKIFVASMFISNLSPAKTGDPIRSVFLKRVKNKSFSTSLSSVILERIIDLVFLLIVAGISMPIVLANIKGIEIWLYLSMAFYTFIIFLIVYVISSEKRSIRFFTWFFRVFSFIPKIKSYEKRVREGSEKLHESFGKYRHAKTLIETFLLTSVIWGIQGAVTFFCFQSIGLYVSPWACVAVIPIVVLIGVLTFLPGSLGSSELIKVTFFTTLFGISMAEVTAVTLLSRLFFFWPYVLVGAILFSAKFK